VVKLTLVHEVATVDDCRRRLERAIGRRKSGQAIGPYVLSVDGKVAGFAGAMRQDAPGAVFDLFYHLGREFWGGGLGSQVAARLVDEAFGAREADAVTASAVTVNNASWRILEKTGFRRIGLDPEGFKNREGHYEVYQYRMERNDYEQRHF
jgi:ribosomal-protein-alanine N-acetyltransferase